MFAENLRRARNKKKLTQQEIAQELGISQQAYAQWERGISSPNPENLRRVAEALGVSVNYLTEENDEIDKLIEMAANKTAEGKMKWEILDTFHMDPWDVDNIDSFIKMGKIKKEVEDSDTIYVSYTKKNIYMFIIKRNSGYVFAFGFSHSDPDTGPDGRVIRIDSQERDLSLLAKEIQRERTEFIEQMIGELGDL